MKIQIAFDISHNEKGNLESSYKTLPKSLGHEKFDLLSHNEFPINYENISEYQILIIAQPINNYLSDSEINDLVKFVENGKSLLLLGDSGGDRAHMSNLNSLAAKFGVKFNDDKVTDKKNFLEEMDVVVIKHLKLHPIFNNNIKEIIYPKGCSLEIISSSLAEAIAWTGEQATPPKKAVIIASKRKFGRVITSGSYLQFLYNAIIFNNIIDWLIGEEKVTEIKAPTIKFAIPKILKSSSAEQKSIVKEIIATDDKTIRDHIKSIIDILEKLKDTQKDLGKYKTFKTKFEFFIKMISSRLNIDLPSTSPQTISTESDDETIRNHIRSTINFLEELKDTQKDLDNFSTFKKRFEFFIKIISSRLDIDLPSTSKQILAEESTNIAILNKKIKELEMKKEASIQLNKYIRNQYDLNIISDSEYENKIENIRKEIQEIDEKIDLLKSKLRIVEEM